MKRIALTERDADLMVFLLSTLKFVMAMNGGQMSKDLEDMLGGSWELKEIDKLTKRFGGH